MKQGILKIISGTFMIGIYMLLAYVESGKLQGPTYVITLLLKDGSIFAAVVWMGIFAMSIACIILGIKHLIFHKRTPDNLLNITNK